jgi:hypothetical protein
MSERNKEWREKIIGKEPLFKCSKEKYLRYEFLNETKKVEEYKKEFKKLYDSLEWVIKENIGKFPAINSKIINKKLLYKQKMDDLDHKLLANLKPEFSNGDIEKFYNRGFIESYRELVVDLNKFEKEVSSNSSDKLKKKPNKEKERGEKEERELGELLELPEILDFPSFMVNENPEGSDESEESSQFGDLQSKIKENTYKMGQTNYAKTQCGICGAYSELMDRKLKIPFCNTICQKKYYDYHQEQ